MSDSKGRGFWILWAVSGLIVLYGAAWLVTATAGTAQVKESWENEVAANPAVPMVRVDRFDPEAFAPPPDFDPTQYYVGRCVALCPFLVSIDDARWNSEFGTARRSRISWFFGRMTIQSRTPYWVWRRGSPAKGP